MQPAERTKSVYFLRHAEGVGHPVVAAVFDFPSLVLPGEHNLKIPGAVAIHDAHHWQMFSPVLNLGAGGRAESTRKPS